MLVRIVARTSLLPIVVIAIIAAVLMAFLSLLNAIFKNPVIAIPQSVIAALAALGLTDGDVWAGYGFALFLGCATAAKVYASLPVESLANPYFLATAIVPLAIAALAFLAGKALAARGARSPTGPIPWLALAAIPLSLAAFLHLVVISSTSMEPTLFRGDTIAVRRAGAASIRRGDLLVYREPAKQDVLVKRVVGIGGDRIHLDRKTLHLNGRPIYEPYVLQTGYLDQYRDNFPVGDINVPLSPGMKAQLQQQVRDGEFVVPAQTFFVLGDNRDRALDSRYSGVIPATAVVGKAWVVFFSADLPGDSAVHNVLVCARWNRVLKRL